jgi:hypothetical protein
MIGRLNDRFVPNNTMFLFLLLLGRIVSNYSAQLSVLKPPSVHCIFFALGESGASISRRASIE